MTEKTKFGLLGNSLKNSFSVGYFTEKFKQQGQNFTYENFELTSINEFKHLLANEPLLKGLNVTKPNKELIIPFLHDLAESARSCGAVNCIEIKENGRLVGHNTDIFGFKISLEGSKELQSNIQALILGNGGASKAVESVLHQMQIPYKIVARRNKRDYSFEEITDDLIKQHLFIIQTTPIGMFPDINEKLPCAMDGITDKHFCYDLIYLPKETQFLKIAREAGAKTLNGLNMLHAQADESYRIWMNSKT